MKTKILFLVIMMIPAVCLVFFFCGLAEAISDWFYAKADEIHARAEKIRHEIRISREHLRKQLEQNEQNEKR